MWRFIKWGFVLAVLVIVGGFLNYTLPQREVVRVISTYNRVTQIGSNWIFYSIEDAGTGAETTSTSRDVRYIDAAYPNSDRTMTYRNEDTGWVWPPYFKWNSSTLQAEATNYISTEAAPKWVAVTSYGWRIPFVSAFPNAVHIAPVASPDVRLIPWVNIIVLVMLAFLVLMGWRMLAQFRERVIDPASDRMAQTFDAVDARADAARRDAAGAWGRFTGWLQGWRGRPRR